MTQYRKPQWPKIVATAALLAVLYVASPGPALWLSKQGLLPEWSSPILRPLYRPLLQTAWMPSPIRSAFGWYIRLWFEVPFPAESSSAIPPQPENTGD